MQLPSYIDLHLIQKIKVSNWFIQKNISSQRKLKSNGILTCDSRIRTFQKSDTFTFHSPFTLSKKSGWPNKAKQFLLIGLNFQDQLILVVLTAALLIFLKNLIPPNENEFKQIKDDKFNLDLVEFLFYLVD